jgi:hypothetical protein
LTNPIDYGYASTPGYSGRIGISFPLGRPTPPAASQAKAAEITRLRSEIQQLQETSSITTQAQAAELNRLRLELQQIQQQMRKISQSRSSHASQSRL